MQDSATLPAHRVSSPCWIPTCSAIVEDNTKLFDLPKNIKAQDVWLALAGKSKGNIEEGRIKFCSEHFLPSDIGKYGNSQIPNGLPIVNMPERVCRTCVSIIPIEQSFHLISSNLTNEMPNTIEDMLAFCVKSKPIALRQMLKVCIPEMLIGCDPSPLMCSKCFIGFWLYYTFIISCHEVEKKFLSNIPIEGYGKMVLCRTCPKTFGTNFYILAEVSRMGTLLKTISSIRTNQRENLPLRVCSSCFKVLEELSTFRTECLYAEKRERQRFELEQRMKNKDDLATDRLSLQDVKQDYYRAIAKSVNETAMGSTQESTSADCEDATKEEDVSSTQGSCPDAELAGDLTVQPEVSDPSATEQLRKEMIDQIVLKCVNELTAEQRGGREIDWAAVCRQLDESQVDCTLKEVKAVWDKQLDESEDKCGRNEPIVEHSNLDSSIGEQPTSTVTEKTRKSAKRSFPEGANESAAEADNLQSSTWASSSTPSTSTGCDSSIMKKKPRSSGKTVSPLTAEERVEFLKLVEEEFRATYMGKATGDGKPRPIKWRPVIGNVYKNNEKFQRLSLASLCTRWYQWRAGASGDKIVRDGMARLAALEATVRISGAGVESTPSTSSVQKTPKPTLAGPKSAKKKLQHWKTRQKLHNRTPTCNPSRVFSFSDRLRIVREVAHQYDLMLKDGQKFSNERSPPWRTILQRMADGNFLEASFDKLYSVFSRLRTSARIYEKDGRDVCDEEMWSLLELHKAQSRLGLASGNVARTESDSDEKTEGEEVSGSNSKDGGNGDCTADVNSASRPDPVIEIQAPIEFQSTSNAAAVDNPKVIVPENEEAVKTHRRFTDEEKYELCKAIKQAYSDYLKKNRQFKSWTAILNSMNGYKNLSRQQVQYMWSKMTLSVSQHKNNNNMTHLDWKVDRMLSSAKGLNLPDSPVKPKEKDRTRPANKEKRKRTSLRRSSVCSDGAAATEDMVSDDDPAKKWTHVQKLDLISAVKNMGSDAFKKAKDVEPSVWDKFYEELEAKGYDVQECNKLHAYWRYLKRSATMAMGNSKEPSCYDELVIDFMKSVAARKEKRNSDCSLTTADGKEEVNSELPQVRHEQSMEMEETEPEVSPDGAPTDTEKPASQDLSYDYISYQDIERKVKPPSAIKREPLTLALEDVIDLCYSDLEDETSDRND